MSEKTLLEIAREAFDQGFNAATGSLGDNGISLFDADTAAIQAAANAVAEKCAETIQLDSAGEWSSEFAKGYARGRQDAQYHIRNLIQKQEGDAT